VVSARSGTAFARYADPCEQQGHDVDADASVNRFDTNLSQKQVHEAG
jgi:hypothetical protein